jgi:hypothetical protein
MRCHEFEEIWQQHLDNGSNPQHDTDLVVHAMSCESCHALLEGTDHLLALSAQPAASVLSQDHIIIANLLSSQPNPHADRSSFDYQRITASPARAMAGSRPLAIAAGLMALIAFTLWGRVWMSVFEPANRVALAKNAVEESLSGPLSARNAFSDTAFSDTAFSDTAFSDTAFSDVTEKTDPMRRQASVAAADPSASPLVPSPLQLVLKARETRYLLTAGELDNLAAWNQRWLDLPSPSSDLITLGLEPLTASFEVAMELIRITLPGNWTLTQNEGYNLLTSPLQAAFSEGN